MSAQESPPRTEPTALQQFRSAPLVPLTISATLGIIFDRYAEPGPQLWLIVFVALLVGWFLTRGRSIYLLLAGSALAGMYHHAHRHIHAVDDIGLSLSEDPAILSVRGVLAETPLTKKKPSDPLVAARTKDSDSALLDVQHIRSADGEWQTASGRLRIIADHELGDGLPLHGLDAGDLLELSGMAFVAGPPTNPGEADLRNYFLDQRIRGVIRVAGTRGTIVKLDSAEWSFARFLAGIRSYSTRSLQANLNADDAPTARALLLADGSAMERREWDSYIRTGVVHVLAISGQHLVVLAAFIWILAAELGLPRAHAAWVVVGVVLLYAAVTGLRPSAVRAAIMVTIVCGAYILERPVHRANAFAASWLIVLLLNPTDLFTLGCKLSFLCVFILIWGMRVWASPRSEISDAERLVELFRPTWQKILLALFRMLKAIFHINFVLFLVNVPLLIAEQNLISPIGLLVGPLLILLTSIALLAGFSLLLFAWLPGMNAILASVTGVSLGLCRGVVQWADGLPSSSIYTPGLPYFWLVGFYLLLGLIVFCPARIRWNCWWGMLAWLAVALLLMQRGTEDELRITFLNIGHGGCAVMETPDGRVMIYDIGTLSGPDAVRRVIAPYLWSRKIHRVDEVFLSHADADHFNNLPELLRRFSVGRVTLTPTFANKATLEVAATLQAIRERNVPMRIVSRSDTFDAGEVELQVLHPTESMKSGTENERSLVLLVRYRGRVLLLPGDLEGAGTSQFLQLNPIPVDVLLAPHHGSPAAFTPGFSKWCSAKFIVVSRGRAFGAPIRDGAAGPSVPIWSTRYHGAVTVRCHNTGIVAESFLLKDRFVIAR